jgi:hypothetical protein
MVAAPKFELGIPSPPRLFLQDFPTGAAHSSYWVFMDTPRGKFFKISRIAFEAMWDSKTVEIKWSIKEGGDNLLKDIGVVRKKSNKAPARKRR